MTNEEAILRLACDMEDTLALVAIAEYNGKVLKATVTRYFVDPEIREKALLTLLIRISWRAKYFVQGHDVADIWIEACAEMECRRLRNEIAARGAKHEGVTVLLQPGSGGFVGWLEKCSDKDEEKLRSPEMLPFANDGRWN